MRVRVSNTCRVLAALLVLAPLTACASMWRGTARTYDLAPNGLSRSDDAFRRGLMVGSYSETFQRAGAVKQGAPTDPLLRALYRGLSAHYAGDFAESARAFAEADRLTEERQTKSASRAALSVVTNDLALPYLPSRTERLFLRYYAMVSYARAGNHEGAVVEARRLGRQLENDGTTLHDDERALHAVMRDAAGAVFEMAGETNDALVSYRNAAILRGASRDEADSIRLHVPGGDSATVVLFVERGFVAHRVDRGFTIGLDDDDFDRQTVVRSGKRRRSPVIPTVGPVVSATPADITMSPVSAPDAPRDSVLTGPPSPTNSVIPKVKERLAREESTVTTERFRDEATLISNIDRWLGALPDEGLFINSDADFDGWRQGRSLRVGSVLSNRFLRLAWPALARSRLPDAQMLIAVDSVSHALGSGGADVSAAVAADLRRARPAMIARVVARAAAKSAIVESIDDKHPWMATLASIAGSSLERADTRSWHLLPGEVRVVRLTVPAGTHNAVLRVGDGLNALPVRLPSLTLSPGSVRIVDARVWRDATGLLATSH